MKLHVSLILAFIPFSFLTKSCEEINRKTDNSDIEFISYGTSFGECLGYCQKKLTINENTIEFSKLGWDLEGSLPIYVHEEAMDQDFWTSVVDQVNFDLFLQLDPVIGCPDCADGGAEWLEIKKNDSLYKVTFEFMNEPDLLSDYMGYLRTYLAAFGEDTLADFHFNDRVFINQKARIIEKNCSWSCFQYLVEIISEGDTSLYFDEYLDTAFQHHQLEVKLNGVLRFDSTQIYRGGPADEQIPDFKARNIRIQEIEMLTE